MWSTERMQEAEKQRRGWSHLAIVTICQGLGPGAAKPPLWAPHEHTSPGTHIGRDMIRTCSGMHASWKHAVEVKEGLEDWIVVSHKGTLVKDQVHSTGRREVWFVQAWVPGPTSLLYQAEPIHCLLLWNIPFHFLSNPSLGHSLALWMCYQLPLISP